MKRGARKAAGYVCAPQFELPMDGGFRLVAEQAEDGERIAQERARARTEELAQRTQQAAQTFLF